MEQATRAHAETEARYPLHWQRTHNTTDPEVVLRRLDAIRARVKPMPDQDSTETIRASRESGLARE